MTMAKNIAAKASYTPALRLDKMNLVAADTWRLNKIEPLDLDPISGKGIFKLSDVLVAALSSSRNFRKRFDVAQMMSEF